MEDFRPTLDTVEKGQVGDGGRRVPEVPARPAARSRRGRRDLARASVRIGGQQRRLCNYQNGRTSKLEAVKWAAGPRSGGGDAMKLLDGSQSAVDQFCAGKRLRPRLGIDEPRVPRKHTSASKANSKIKKVMVIDRSSIRPKELAPGFLERRSPLIPIFSIKTPPDARITSGSASSISRRIVPATPIGRRGEIPNLA